MDDLTTLVCLFHHQSQAQNALRDLRDAGVPETSISVIEGMDALEKSELAALGMPDRDYDHLKDGIRDGGTVVAVSSLGDHVPTVERIFNKHQAQKIDEVEAEASGVLPVVPPAAAEASGEVAIPVIQEDLVVGKRTVDAGGVRLFRRVLEVPVEDSVTLHEEHVRVERTAVDRPVTDVDQAFVPREIALTETAEEAVVGKEARVVEEIVVGKTATERTETIHDTVRRTEVELEELPGETVERNSRTSTDTY